MGENWQKSFKGWPTGKSLWSVGKLTSRLWVKVKCFRSQDGRWESRWKLIRNQWFNHPSAIMDITMYSIALGKLVREGEERRKLQCFFSIFYRVSSIFPPLPLLVFPLPTYPIATNSDEMTSWKIFAVDMQFKQLRKRSLKKNWCQDNLVTCFWHFAPNRNCPLYRIQTIYVQ